MIGSRGFFSKVGSSAAVAAQEQTELAQLKSQVNVINQELDSFYVRIGRRYIDYVLETGDMPGIDTSDLLKLMDPKMTKKKELKQQAEETYLAEKAKLDKALSMELMSQTEYVIQKNTYYDRK